MVLLFSNHRGGPLQRGRLRHRKDEGVWIIIDAGKHIRTRCSYEQREEAAEALGNYLAAKMNSRPVQPNPSIITLGEVMALYADEVGPEQLHPTRTAYAIKALAPFWGHLTPSDITIPKRRDYQEYRAVSSSTIRRELGVLNAALNYAEKAIHLFNAPRVTLPKKTPPRNRWLTEPEVDLLMKHSPDHLKRFILISIFTGRRKTSVLNLRWQSSPSHGWIDLQEGVACFKGTRISESKKQRGLIKLPNILLEQANTWRLDGMESVIHFKGKPLSDIDRSFETACRKAGIKNSTPHTLKHTSVTWAFQKGMTIEDAADYFSTSAPTLLEVYRQHSPHHQDRAVSVMDEIGSDFIANNVAD